MGCEGTKTRLALLPHYLKESNVSAAAAGDVLHGYLLGLGTTRGMVAFSKYSRRFQLFTPQIPYVWRSV